MDWMFYKCRNLKEINIINFNTYNVVDMYSMFAECPKLTSIHFGQNFTTKNARDVFNMFDKCNNDLINKIKYESKSIDPKAYINE